MPATAETAGAAGLVGAWSAQLAALDLSHTPDGGLVDVITALETLKSAACAAQARASVALDVAQRAAQRAAGVPAARVGSGVGDQVALARHESPACGQRHLNLATLLVTQLPHTLQALQDGEVTEWQATLVARATAPLSPQQRASLDQQLAGRSRPPQGRPPTTSTPTP